MKDIVDQEMIEAELNSCLLDDYWDEPEKYHSLIDPFPIEELVGWKFQESIKLADELQQQGKSMESIAVYTEVLEYIDKHTKGDDNRGDSDTHKQIRSMLLDISNPVLSEKESKSEVGKSGESGALILGESGELGPNSESSESDSDSSDSDSSSESESDSESSSESESELSDSESKSKSKQTNSKQNDSKGGSEIVGKQVYCSENKVDISEVK